MKVTFTHLILLLLAITAGHFYANASGLYQGEVIWADNVLHFLAGIFLGLLCIKIFERENFSKRKLILAMLLFGIVGALGWGLFEQFFWYVARPLAARYSFYSPTFAEAFSDFISSLFGTIFFSFYYYFRALK